MKIVNEKNGARLIGSIFIVVIAIFFLVDPVSQSLDYHIFSDAKGLSYLPNTLNVLSNVPFILVGIIGLIAMYKQGKRPLNILIVNKLSYLFLFLGSVLVGLGSGYYHISPSNEALVWDRIPMTIAFMGLYSIIISEFVSEKVGKLSLIPLVVIGISSVLYWRFTEIGGAGDLRFYAVVQFFPILTIPIMLIFFRPKFDHTIGYWVLISSYVGAKVFETFDYQIHGVLQVISGHSIKHVLPALGLYYLIVIYQKRVST
jgi:hypothetical protein